MLDYYICLLSICLFAVEDGKNHETDGRSKPSFFFLLLQEGYFIVNLLFVKLGLKIGAQKMRNCSFYYSELETHSSVPGLAQV